MRWFLIIVCTLILIALGIFVFKEDPNSKTNFIWFMLTIIITYFLSDAFQRKNYYKNLRGEAKKALRHIDTIGSCLESSIEKLSNRIRKAKSLKDLRSNLDIVVEYLISTEEQLENLFLMVKASINDWKDILPDKSKTDENAIVKLSDGRTTSDELENLLGKHEQLYLEIGSKEKEIKIAQSKKEKLERETEETKFDKLNAEERKKELDKEIAQMKKEKEKAQSERDGLDREIKEKKNELKSIGNELKNIAPLTSLPFTFDSAAKTFSSSSSSSLTSSSRALSFSYCPICRNLEQLTNECIKCKLNVCDNCYNPTTNLCKNCGEIKLDPNIKIDLKNHLNK